MKAIEYEIARCKDGAEREICAAFTWFGAYSICAMLSCFAAAHTGNLVWYFTALVFMLYAFLFSLSNCKRAKHWRDLADRWEGQKAYHDLWDKLFKNSLFSGDRYDGEDIHV